MTDAPRKTERKPRIPKKITQNYLENYALFYLQRFSSTSKNLHRILMRRVKKSLAHHGEPSLTDAIDLVDAVVNRYVELGLVNDELYAQSRTHSLRRAGNSKRQISAKLFAKGLDGDQIDQAVTHVDTEHGHEYPELAAAKRYVKRRRLGQYRTRPVAPDDIDARHQKDLASLARAGFSYDIASKALVTKKDGDQ